MKLPFVLRSRHDADIEALKADRDRLRTQRDEARTERDAFRHTGQLAARQFAETDAVNQRLAKQIIELADPERKPAADLEQQLADARKELAAVVEADSVVEAPLQVVGALRLGGHVRDSRQYQPGYEKPKADAS